MEDEGEQFEELIDDGQGYKHYKNLKFYDKNVENIFLWFYLFLYPVISENDQEPMSDEEDDQMDETEAEKEAQYGFELENGTFFGEIS